MERILVFIISAAATVSLMCLILPLLFHQMIGAVGTISTLGDKKRIPYAILWFILYGFCAAVLIFTMMVAFAVCIVGEKISDDMKVAAPWIAGLFAITAVITAFSVYFFVVRRKAWGMPSQSRAAEGEFMAIPQGGIGEADGPVFFRRYVLSGSGTGQQLSLRFYNGTKSVGTGICFSVHAKDVEGRVIYSRQERVERINGQPHSEFGVPDILVPQSCVEVEVRIDSFRTDEYEYVPTENGYTVSYLNAAQGKYRTGKRKAPLKKRTYSAMAVLIPLLIFAVAMAILLFAFEWSYYRFS